MSWRIIVASSDGAQRAELLKGAVAIANGITASGDAAEIQEAATVAVVKSLLRGANKDLVIVTAALSEGLSAPGAQNQAGLELIKRIQSQNLPPPCILVSDRSEHRSLTKAMARCRLLAVGSATDYIEDCERLAKELDVCTGDAAPARVAIDEFALIEVDLPNEARLATVRYVINVEGLSEEPSTQPLGLNQKRMDELVAESRKLSDRFSKALKSARTYKRWQMDYRSLGERFHKLLDTVEFAKHLHTIEGVVKGRNHLDIRLRFSLGRQVFDGLWESICDPKGEHLMLAASITRRERDAIGSFAQSRSGAIGTLNILVIGSTLDDNSAPEGPGDPLWDKHWGRCQLASLPHIKEEVAAIKALEQSPYKVKVDVLSGEQRHEEPHKSDDEWSLAEVVRKHLAANPNYYDVVHFAGHALFAAAKPNKRAAGKRGKPANNPVEDDRGYLVFTGKENPRAISIATVAGWLKNTSVELVYLSCCRSGASRAAAEFAKNSIRTTIGFSWDLVDKRAVDFTRQFYDELLKNRLNVCSALRKAREDLHGVYQSGDPIWASPVLFAQPPDWKHVEGVLRPPVRLGPPVHP
jgi:CHAT domain